MGIHIMFTHLIIMMNLTSQFVFLLNLFQYIDKWILSVVSYSDCESIQFIYRFVTLTTDRMLFRLLSIFFNIRINFDSLNGLSVILKVSYGRLLMMLSLIITIWVHQWVIRRHFLWWDFLFFDYSFNTLRQWKFLIHEYATLTWTIIIILLIRQMTAFILLLEYSWIHVIFLVNIVDGLSFYKSRWTNIHILIMKKHFRIF